MATFPPQPPGLPPVPSQHLDPEDTRPGLCTWTSTEPIGPRTILARPSSLSPRRSRDRDARLSGPGPRCRRSISCPKTWSPAARCVSLQQLPTSCPGPLRISTGETLLGPPAPPSPPPAPGPGPSSGYQRRECPPARLTVTHYIRTVTFMSMAVPMNNPSDEDLLDGWDSDLCFDSVSGETTPSSSPSSWHRPAHHPLDPIPLIDLPELSDSGSVPGDREFFQGIDELLRVVPDAPMEGLSSASEVPSPSATVRESRGLTRLRRAWRRLRGRTEGQNSSPRRGLAGRILQCVCPCCLPRNI